MKAVGDMEDLQTVILPTRTKDKISHKLSFPQIKEWLEQHADLAHEGSDSLGFFYSNEDEEFQPKRDTRLKPIRSSKQKL